MGRARWMGRVLLVMVGQLAVFATTATAQSDACRVGQVLDPGDYCTVDIPGLSVGSNRFEVRSDGRGCYGSICSGTSLNLSGFTASRVSGTSQWRIDALPPTVPALPAAGLVMLTLLLLGAGARRLNKAAQAASRFP